MIASDEISTRKAELRREMTVRRKALDPALLDQRGVKVQSRLLASLYYQRAKTIALYAPIKGEVPTRDILLAALGEGKTVCYPLSHVHGRILSFRVVANESELEAGRLGVREPSGDADLVPLEAIELFVVPGLAFSKDGKRLGRGGGYFDATLLSGAPFSRRVGLALAEQIVDTLPVTSDDVVMDLVVTENESFRGLDRDWSFASS